ISESEEAQALIEQIFGITVRRSPKTPTLALPLSSKEILPVISVDIDKHTSSVHRLIPFLPLNESLLFLGITVFVGIVIPTVHQKRLKKG
ncbi:MAG: hypothetical protein ACFFCQ_08840, partial [Promethearchaeota archaeon]